MSRASVLDRFEQRYEPVPEAGCWIWTGRANPKGYGRIGIGRNKQFAAHRVSWQLFRGGIPTGMCVCHKCDTPSCVNPDHLFLGTHADNAGDRQSKGRGAINRGGGGWNRGVPYHISHPDAPIGRRRAAQMERNA